MLTKLLLAVVGSALGDAFQVGSQTVSLKPIQLDRSTASNNVERRQPQHAASSMYI
jgi:hypothetical protein